MKHADAAFQRGCRVVSAVAALVFTAGAYADGLSAQLEPRYLHSEVDTTDAERITTTTITDAFLQRYRLNWSRELTQSLRFGSGAVLDDSRRWSDPGAFGHSTTSSAFANLAWGTSVLGGALGYDWRRLESGSGRVLINEGWRSNTGWRPIGGPSFTLDVFGSERYDEARAAQDTSTFSAALGASYQPWESSSFDYTVRFSRAEDRISLTEARSIDQTARASAARVAWDGRWSLSGSYSLSAARVRTILDQSTGGSVVTQNTPTAGLFAIETFPSTPERIVLGLNAALVDGNVEQGSGVNLGFSASAGRVEGDPRHLGVQYVDPATTTNELHVYVDQSLPEETSRLFEWAVYQSDDGEEWQRVTLIAAVAFDPFSNRFELRFANVTAAYVKVVVQPLASGASTDERFATINVTELQVFLRTTLTGTGELEALTVRTNGALTTSSVIRLLPGLAYDTTLLVTHSRSLDDSAYNLTNGLGFARRLGQDVAVGARAQRTDVQSGGSHQSRYTYNSSISADLLPTLQLGAAYSGNYARLSFGPQYSNAVSALARAELYSGVDLGTNVTYSRGTGESGRISATTYNASLAVRPHPRLTTDAAYSLSKVSSGTLDFPTEQRVTGSASANPIGRVFVAASVGRVITGPVPTTTAIVSTSWSPLAGGALQLSLNFNRSIETASEQLQQSFSSGLRWNIRPGTRFDVSYVLASTDTPSLETTSRTLGAGLVIGL